MKTPSLEDRVKPFRLVKYFTFTSLILIFLGALVLSVLTTHWARNMQLKKNEDYARLLVKNLNHQIFLQFFIPVTLQYGQIQLRDRNQYELMDKVVRSALHSFNVDMITIYDNMSNIVSYSFDRELIGKRNEGGIGYQKARAGQWTSRLVQKGNFLETLLGNPQEIKIVTYAPLRLEKARPGLSGPMIGVVEIVQDLSEDYKTIFRFEVLVVITSTVVMSVLLGVLIFVVKRGEDIIETRARERLRLKEQLARAERLSSMGEMVAAISHEIRNPLGIIISSAELLKKKVTDQDPGNTIPDIIVEESRRLNNIITDFFNYAKPREPNLEPCRAEEIFEKNLKFLAPQIESRGYAVITRFDDDLPEVMADPGMIYQVFLNLLINAMQAMPGGGTIQVGITTRDARVRITIEDEGGGIPDDLSEKIWDPFFTTKEKGTGLGLGIVKNIIESHGGDIRLVNRRETGARVEVEIPVMQER